MAPLPNARVRAGQWAVAPPEYACDRHACDWRACGWTRMRLSSFHSRAVPIAAHSRAGSDKSIPRHPHRIRASKPNFGGCFCVRDSRYKVEFKSSRRGSGCTRIARGCDSRPAPALYCRATRISGTAVAASWLWRFRSPHHFSGKSEMRTSEPKPHQVNKLLVSVDSESSQASTTHYDFRSSQASVPHNDANFGIGTL